MIPKDKGRTTPSGYFFDAFVDAVAPLLTYVVLHGLGVPAFPSLVIGCLVAVISTVVHTVRRKRLDGVGVLILAEIAVSILLQYYLRDPRLLMVKPSLYSAVGAFYLTFTAFGDKPLTYTGSRPMATQGDPRRIAAYEQAWRNSRAFRALHRAATLGWASAFFADAILRAVIIYGFPLERAVWLANVPHVVAVLLLVGFSALVGRKSKPLVEEQLRIQGEKEGTQATIV